MKAIVTQPEFDMWMLYFTQKQPDVTEVQLAMLATIVSNGLGGKTKVGDFIFSAKDGTDQAPKPMAPDDLAMAMRSML